MARGPRAGSGRPTTSHGKAETLERPQYGFKALVGWPGLSHPRSLLSKEICAHIGHTVWSGCEPFVVLPAAGTYALPSAQELTVAHDTSEFIATVASLVGATAALIAAAARAVSLWKREDWSIIGVFPARLINLKDSSLLHEHRTGLSIQNILAGLAVWKSKRTPWDVHPTTTCAKILCRRNVQPSPPDKLEMALLPPAPIR